MCVGGMGGGVCVVQFSGVLMGRQIQKFCLVYSRQSPPTTEIFSPTHRASSRPLWGTPPLP